MRRVVQFMEKLRVPSGIGQGNLLVLEGFQVEWILLTYGPVHVVAGESLRRVRRSLLSIARKNGKTAIVAALVLVHLIGPEAKQNGEILSAASDRRQASIVYKMARQMVELDPELSELIEPLNSIKSLKCAMFGSQYTSLSADARRQHGGNPSLVIYDELAQALNREMYDVLSTSFGAQPEPLLAIISTQSNDPISIMSELVDDAEKFQSGELDDPYFCGRVYRVPEDADIWDEKNWYLANPALGKFRDLTDMRAQAMKAKRSPSAEAAFRNLLLNQRTDANRRFVSSTDWRACAGDVPDSDLAGADCYGGLDLSSRADLCALTLAFPRTDGTVVTRCWFWLPVHEIEDKEKKDGAQYVVWSQAGFLTLVPGRVVDYAYIAEELAKVCAVYNVKSIGYDRWRIETLRAELDKIGAKVPLENFGQGFKDMSPAIEALENQIISHSLRHGGDPVLTYCMSNVITNSDAAGNRKFDKRNPNRRIDGAVSTAQAMALLSRNATVETVGPSVYETRGIRRL